MESFSMVTAKGMCQFRINHSQTKDMPTGMWITSPKFWVGGQEWVVNYFPRGNKMSSGGKYASFFLELKTEPANVTARFGFGLLNKHGIVSYNLVNELVHTFTSCGSDWGYSDFLERDILETYVKDGYIVLHVSVSVKDESCTGACPNSSPIAFPRECLQKLREEKKHTDVSFNVHGKVFDAHRLILAVHSPVFEAELFGSMAESNLDCITIEEMVPSVFKAMLDFMYNGSISINGGNADNNQLSPSMDFLQKLLAAADRYVIEKLRVVCEHKLIKGISLDNVLSFLEFAANHNCSELKKGCLRFIADKNNLVSLLLTEGYINLMQNCPSLLIELKELASR
jgi:speckle-type POZ protein